MAVGIFVTGAFTLLVPTGRPSEKQNNPVMYGLILKYLMQLSTFLHCTVHTLLDVFTGRHLHEQTMVCHWKSLVGQIPPLWNQEKYV